MEEADDHPVVGDAHCLLDACPRAVEREVVEQPEHDGPVDGAIPERESGRVALQSRRARNRASGLREHRLRTVGGPPRGFLGPDVVGQPPGATRGVEHDIAGASGPRGVQ